MAETWVRAISLAELGESLSVKVAGREVALFKTESGIYALDDTCSHEHSRLSEGEVFEDEVYCPKHGSRFSLRDGSVTGFPATRPVRTWPVRVEGGAVWIASRPAEPIA